MSSVESKVTAATLGAVLGQAVVLVLALFDIVVDANTAATIGLVLAGLLTFAAGYYKPSSTSTVSDRYQMIHAGEAPIPRVPYQADPSDPTG